MRPFEKTIEAACAEEAIPGAVLLAADRSGKPPYARAFGKRSVRAGADQSPLTIDSVMWIASCTKVVTSLAAMQCVERGLLTLDGPIYDVLPEFKSKPVIEDFSDSGEPILVPHRNAITLRHLLNHSSGIAYDEVEPKLVTWRQWHKIKASREDTAEKRFSYPLVFHAGESWTYGAGIDWAGVMVERVCKCTLQEYFEKNIFDKVGARDIVFSSYLNGRPDMKKRVADMSKRDPDRPGKVKRSNARLQWNETGGCLGGLGLFAAPSAYFKFTQGLLSTDTDERLLKKESLEEFFRPCLTEQAKEALNTVLSMQETRDGMGGFPWGVSVNWALGGIVNEQDVPGGRKAGTMTWTGLPNLAWFVDRKTGVCGFYAGQVVPPGDHLVAELCRAFEKGIYEMYDKPSTKL